MKKRIKTRRVQPEPREAYQEPLLIRHEPLLDITGVKTGEKRAAGEKQPGPQGGIGGVGGEAPD